MTEAPTGSIDLPLLMSCITPTLEDDTPQGWYQLAEFHGSGNTGSCQPVYVRLDLIERSCCDP